jgi:hypothetical protein
MRYLVVANKTLADGKLFQAIEERVSMGACEFWVLVPQPRTSRRPLRGMGELLADVEAGLPRPGISSDHPVDDELSPAQQRLDVAVGQIRRLGGTAQGEVVEEPDPLRAIESVLARQEFDEIILSTLPKHVSAWLHIDLPRRLARRFQGPVTHVETDNASPSS